MTHVETPEFLKVKELMVRLRISRATADKLIKDGAIPSMRAGRGSIRIPAQAVEDFIRAQTNQAKEGAQRDAVG